MQKISVDLDSSINLFIEKARSLKGAMGDYEFCFRQIAKEVCPFKIGEIIPYSLQREKKGKIKDISPYVTPRQFGLFLSNRDCGSNTPLWNITITTIALYPEMISFQGGSAYKINNREELTFGELLRRVETDPKTVTASLFNRCYDSVLKILNLEAEVENLSIEIGHLACPFKQGDKIIIPFQYRGFKQSIYSIVKIHPVLTFDGQFKSHQKLYSLEIQREKGYRSFIIYGEDNVTNKIRMNEGFDAPTFECKNLLTYLEQVNNKKSPTLGDLMNN